jgi:hypothetical protein
MATNISDAVTRDGSVSIAAMQIAQDKRDAAFAEVTMADVIAWAGNNRMKPTGDDAKDLASVNRMRNLMKLPPFAVIPQRVVKEIPMPPATEFEPKTESRSAWLR